MSKESPLKVPFSELGGIDRACAAVRGFREGSVELAAASAVLKELSRAQLEVVAFATRSGIRALQAIRDAI